MYKLSRYNFIKETERYGIVVYNTFTGAFITLSSEEYKKLKNFNNYDASDKDIKDWINLGLILKIEIDEKQIVESARFKNTFSKNGAIYRIFTTTSCNAKCFYCYEEGLELTTMEKEDSDIISTFIIKNSKDKKYIVLNWFGGEPLLNPDSITRITQKVTEGLRDSNVKIISSIITNGSLFTDELIDLAKNSWKINQIQISLDGIGEIHNKRKKYNNIEDPFNKTISIIEKLLANNLYVTLRLNYDKENFNNIEKLIYYIKKTFGVNKFLSCYAYPLFNNDNCSNENFVNKDQTERYVNILENLLKDCGYLDYNYLPKRKKNSCFATDPNSFVIDPKGNLYKCSMVMRDKSNCLGNVNQDIELSDKIVKWCNPSLPLECNECVILPLCQGGCRASRILNNEQNYCIVKKTKLDFAMENFSDILSVKK